MTNSVDVKQQDALTHNMTSKLNLAELIFYTHTNISFRLWAVFEIGLPIVARLNEVLTAEP